jgi:(E)-4-hydroxy-3-methylbut-2-enyl-diphosphate synthase
VEKLEQRLAHISEPISLSIIGCVVNGPGEALMTDLGFTGGGAGRGKMYVAGRPDHNVSNEEMIDHIVEMVETRAAQMKAEREQATAAE